MLCLWVMALWLCPKALYFSKDLPLPAFTKGPSTCISSAVILCRKALP